MKTRIIANLARIGTLVAVMFLVGCSFGSPGQRQAEASSADATATGSDGDVMGSYTFSLTAGGTAPLGPTAPTQAQLLQGRAGSGGDVGVNSIGALYAGNGETIVSLPDGTTPTYQACKTGTLFANSARSNAGTAFCIIETSGKIAGVVVDSVNTSQNPSYINLRVTVWENSP